MDQNSTGHRAAGPILATTALVLPPLAVFAPLGAAPLLIVVALGMLLLEGRRCLTAITGLKGLVVLLAALGAWGTASSLWSIIPAHSLFEGLRFLALSFGGLLILGGAIALPAEQRRRIGRWAIVGVAIALVLLAIERFGNMPITRAWLHVPPDAYIPLPRFDRGVIVLVLVLWAALFAEMVMWRRGLLLALVATATIVMASTAAVLALAWGLVVFVAARIAPRFTAAAMIVTTVLLGVAVPVATPSFERVQAIHEAAPWIKWSGIHRLLIWRFGADRAAERPLLGWGMDSARAVPGGQTDLNVIFPGHNYPNAPEAMPLHPHDAALQWQMELGILGLALGLGIAIWAMVRIGWYAELSPARRAGALALTAEILTVGMLSFGIWQAWWLSTLWLAAALFAATGRDESSA